MADGSRSSSNTGTTAWLRVAMPSATDLIFVALLCALVFTPLSVRLLGDAGIGWHIRTGQQILATHAIPHVDSFSSTMAGTPWFAWEWLYDLVVGQLEATLGLNGVVWLTAIVIAAVFAWTFHLLIARGANFFVALGLVLLAVSASMIHFLARPHVVSWLFTLAWFWILDSSERYGFDGQDGKNGRRVWALPLLMLVWVNVHGGFLLGFVLLVIFLVGAAWTLFRTKEGRIEELLQKIAAGKRVRRLTWVGLLSVAASLVNPYGWKLYGHVYSYLSNRFLMDHIDEFQSPNFHGVAQRCFLAATPHYQWPPGGQGPRFANERRADGLIRRVFRALRVAKYPGFFNSSGDGSGALAADNRTRSRILSKNECRRSQAARSCLAGSCPCRDPGDCREWRTGRIQSLDERPLRSQANAGGGR